MARRKARTRKRSTRKGMVRKTARRAYVPKRRARRRSNPKGIMSTPAFRYAGWAAAGAAAETALSQAGIGSKLFPERVMRSAAFAALTIFGGRMLLKGRARENAIAAGIGVLIPGVSNWVGKMDLGAKFSLAGPQAASALTASKTTAKLLRSNPYVVANKHAANSSGLSAIK